VFRDAALCDAALTHRSAGGGHNERLEFLGDSILNCGVARLLYDAHPEADEGELSRLRASLVSGDTLARIAGELGLGEHLRLGGGELKSGGFRRASILADALEAILGAIFLDSGFEAAAAAVKRLIEPRLSDLPSAALLKDPKTRLQELLQGRESWQAREPARRPSRGSSSSPARSIPPARVAAARPTPQPLHRAPRPRRSLGWKPYTPQTHQPR